jgi:S1-C subfamily serine protease
VTARRRLAAATVVALLGVATGCDSGTRSDDAAEPDPVAIAEATVRIRADGCGPRVELGTGTAIPDGLVITAAHVVAGATRVEIVDRLGATVDADVVAFDPDLDVAALRPTREIASPPVVLRSERGQQGERGVVAVISADGTAEPLAVDVLQRATVRTTDIYVEQRVERPGLRIGVGVEPGDSGAMVHLPGGGVGIVWSRSTTTDDQAWTVDLPAELLDAPTRRSLVDSVDVGGCP